jgi:hypothetical protein
VRLLQFIIHHSAFIIWNLGVTSDKPSGSWWGQAGHLSLRRIPTLSVELGSCANRRNVGGGPNNLGAASGWGRPERREEIGSGGRFAQEGSPRRAESRGIMTPGAGARSNRGASYLSRRSGVGAGYRPDGSAEKPRGVAPLLDRRGIPRESQLAPKAATWGYGATSTDLWLARE